MKWYFIIINIDITYLFILNIKFCNVKKSNFKNALYLRNLDIIIIYGFNVQNILKEKESGGKYEFLDFNYL